MIEKEIVIFDFCETLVPFQTGDEFLFRVILDNATTTQKLIALAIKIKLVRKIISILNPKFVIRDYLLPFTKGITKDKIYTTAENYAKTKLIPSINPFMRTIIDDHQTKNLPILIVSGGYEEYLRFVFENDKNIYIIGSKLNYVNDYSSGELDGEACLGMVKVERINSFINFEIDATNSSIYSDCLSDLPLFCMVKENRWLVKLPRKNGGVVMINKLQMSHE